MGPFTSMCVRPPAALLFSGENAAWGHHSSLLRLVNTGRPFPNGHGHGSPSIRSPGRKVLIGATAKAIGLEAPAQVLRSKPWLPGSRARKWAGKEVGPVETRTPTCVCTKKSNERDVQVPPVQSVQRARTHPARALSGDSVARFVIKFSEGSRSWRRATGGVVAQSLRSQRMRSNRAPCRPPPGSSARAAPWTSKRRGPLSPCVAPDLRRFLFAPRTRSSPSLLVMCACY